MFENTYYYFKYDEELYNNILEHLKKELEVVDMYLSKTFNEENDANKDVLKYIEYYQKEYDKYNSNLKDLEIMKDDYLKKKTDLETQKSVLEVNMNFLINTNNELRKKYTKYVDDLVLQQKYISNEDFYFGILDSKLDFEIENDFEYLQQINNEFYNRYVDEKEKLFNYYEYIINLLKNKLIEKMNMIMQERIFRSKTRIILFDYIKNKLIFCNNIVESFIGSKKYDPEIIKKIKSIYDKIEKYVINLFELEKENGGLYIELPINFKNDEKYERIYLDDLNEAKKIFDKFVETNVEFVNKINEEFKLIEDKEKEIVLINEIWEKM